MKGAVFCAFLVCLAEAARGEDTTPRYPRQYGLTCLIQMLEHHPADVWESLPQEANAIFANRRVAAAFVAGRTRHPDAESVLKELLNDPDMIVRRIAAQSLFGVGALRDETAHRYTYAEVLAAEEKARALADEIARHGLRKEDEGKVETLDFNPDKETRARIDAEIRAIQRRAYGATRELIALGRPAAWQLHLLCSHADEGVALSAAYAFQEIDWRTENVAPLWAQEIKPKLEKPVSFDFEDKPVAEVVSDLSAMSGIDIRLSQGYEGKDWDGKAHLVNLRATGMSLELALGWIVRLLDLEYAFAEGGIIVSRRRNIDGSVLMLLDVRDLEAAGSRPKWVDLLKSEVPGADEWLGVAEFGSYLLNHDGLLETVVPWAGSSDDAWRNLKPIFTHLNKLREQRGLPRGAE